MTATAKAYHRHRDAARQRQASLSLAGRNIDAIPAVADPARKIACATDLRLFCETYFPRTFYLPWSDDHLAVLAKIEDVALHGGQFAQAMPRGGGKTTIVETACLWAALYGWRRFLCLIGSDEDHAKGMLESIKSELENNDLLLADFPEVCHPIRSLERASQRATTQLYNNRPTLLTWSTTTIILPTIPGSRASGALVRVAGLLGSFRGMKYKRSDGSTVRPDMVVVDDPQTDESAHSRSQCETRERILAGAVLGLAGPDKAIAGFMPCTVIVEDDLADRILNRKRNPDWQGERMQMLYAFPTNQELWDQYADIRRIALDNHGNIAKATAFYKKNRKAMDAGARVAWPERHEPDEASGLQCAMNLLLKDERAFFAEYQNDPQPEIVTDAKVLTSEQITAQINGLGRGVVPLGTEHVTAFIDIQGQVLYWLAAAWEDDFTGAVIDYGTWPPQRQQYFSMRNARMTLARKYPATAGDVHARVQAGLRDLLADLLLRDWPSEDGSNRRIGRCLVDANWGETSDDIYLVLSRSPHKALLLPAHGDPVGPHKTPYSEYRRKKGELIGCHWRVPRRKEGRTIRHVLTDVYWWKSLVHGRLAMPIGSRGGLALFGNRASAHRLLADHLTAEFPVRTEGRGRTVDVWNIKPSRPDNHWLDCLVGAAVAASIDGASPDGRPTRRAAKKKPRRNRVAYMT